MSGSFFTKGDNMAVQKASGEENLRAEGKVKSGAVTDPPKAGKTDASRGGVQSFDPTANLRADPKVLDGKDKEVTGYTHDVPHGLQHFENDSAHPGSSTRYLGR